MNNKLIKESFIAASTHYNGNINDEWHEIVWLKELHYPERHRFYYVYNHVRFDLEKYQETGEIIIETETKYCSRLPDRFKKIDHKSLIKIGDKVDINSDRFTFKHEGSEILYTYTPPCFNEPPIIAWLDNKKNIQCMATILWCVFRDINSRFMIDIIKID